jgi:acetyl-CoA synthetase
MRQALSRLDMDEQPDGRWHIRIPARANLTQDTIGLHAQGLRAEKLALRDVTRDGSFRDFSYAQLDDAVRRCASMFRALGVARGDRVALHAGQSAELAIAHLATYRIGAIAATISTLYGPATVAHVLADSTPRLVVSQQPEVLPPGLPLLVIGTPGPGQAAFASWVDHQPEPGPCEDTAAEDPMLLVYTSGSTGQPKGVLHAHRILHGYKPTLELFFNLELRDPDVVMWTPSDWAWIAGLIDDFYPALQFGQTVITSQDRFDPERALDFMARHGVTHALLMPTALNRMAQIADPPMLRLRVIFTGGEPLPASTSTWIHEKLGAVVNEGYGMSEVNHMIGNCAALRPIRPGSMGWEFPGHVAELVDEHGVPVAEGEVGEIVTTEAAPTLFLGYWKQPERTAATRLGPWVRTHDLAVRDADGYFWFRGRSDDLIKSSGFRIGPTEIEDALMAHPAVAECAVVGVLDAMRGQIVKAFCRVAEGCVADEALAEALRGHVRDRLGPFKAPRLVEFITEFPLTSTGKISRRALRG